MRLTGFLIWFWGMGLLFAPLSTARTLVITFSDSHSHYGSLVRFLIEAVQVTERFRATDPEGTVVFNVNGDFAGMSAQAEDYGDSVYELITLLAKRGRVVVNLGNHDGFDWEGKEGNELFLRQTRKLLRDVSEIQGHPFFLTNANVKTTALGAELIRPYQDVSTKHGTIRFGNTVLDEYFTKSGYSFKEGPQIFRGLDPSAEVAERLMYEAAADRNVKAFIFSSHDMFDRVVPIKEQLNRLRNNHDALKHLAMPWAYAAHDHLQLFDKAAGVIDSGSSFLFTSSLIENDFSRGQVTFYPQEGAGPSEADDKVLNVEERAFVARVQVSLANVEKENAIELGRTKFYLGSKAETKRGPNASGRVSASALWTWGQTVASTLTRRLPVVTFYNSSSYRRDQPIQAGEMLTVGKVKSVYPFSGTPVLFRVRGEDIFRLYRSLRLARWKIDGTHTPQLSPNLVEVGKKSRPRLVIQGEDGRFRRLQKNGEYYLVLDKFLAHNGYGVPEWDEIFKRMERIEVPEAQAPEQQRVLLESFAYWSQITDCAAEMRAIEEAAYEGEELED